MNAVVPQGGGGGLLGSAFDFLTTPLIGDDTGIGIPGIPGFAEGGDFETGNPVAIVDLATGQPQAVAGEAGPEKIEVTPMRGRARHGKGNDRFGASRNQFQKPPQVKQSDVLRFLAQQTRRRVNVSLPG
jgi:hypothetical protein